VRSVTTINSPHNGTHLVRKEGGKDILKKALSPLPNGKSIIPAPAHPTPSTNPPTLPHFLPRLLFFLLLQVYGLGADPRHPPIVHWGSPGHLLGALAHVVEFLDLQVLRDAGIDFGACLPA